MKINEDLVITGLMLDGFELPIPNGLSELINRSSAWVLKTESATQEEGPLVHYDRKVLLENGKLRTYLTKKANYLKETK